MTSVMPLIDSKGNELLYSAPTVIRSRPAEHVEKMLHVVHRINIDKVVLQEESVTS